MLKDEETKVPPEGQLRGNAVIPMKRLARLGASLASESASLTGAVAAVPDLQLPDVSEMIRLAPALAQVRAEIDELKKRVAALENAAKVTA